MALHKPEHRTVKYWLFWPMLAILYALLLPYGLLHGRFVYDEKGKKHWNLEWYQALEDYIDDPIDWLKHKLFGIGELP